MTPKKTKEKERRRARKLADEAWEAANDGNLDLAEKIIRRAVATQIENPVLWNDQGMLLVLRNKETEAEEAFRAAITLAPTFAEPFAQLAALRARQGYVRDAIRLLEQAVLHAPDNPLYAQRLAGYRALLDHPDEPAVLPVADSAPPLLAVGEAPAGIASRDWGAIGQRLTQEGCVLVPRLLDATVCGQLRGIFDEDALFAKTVVMARDDFGRGTYRYFQAPIPAVVDGLRRAVYPHVARIANQWQTLLNEPERFPEQWESFRLRCAEAGQTTPTPILLKYGPGGCNALHRDLRGSVYFPIQLAVVLSPRDHPDGFRGGAFLLEDAPAGKKARRRELPAGLGDGILFCTRDRLVHIGGAYGLQPVKHGVAEITAGTRLVLGVPFHDYR